MGTSIFFVDRSHRILLVLRDDTKGLPFPDCWDMPGGHVEPGETPVQCICREMNEEMGLHLEDPSLFTVVDMPDRIECCFWQRADFDTLRIRLTEGQRIQWFSEAEVARIPDHKLAFGFRPIITDFFRLRPFDRGPAP
ncbi:MAG TPA: NUDIX domain-containing protein [Spirochaetia bacterium]|nr:NUDIX domain-containing protein [Spirochaetia bacterium]